MHQIKRFWLLIVLLILLGLFFYFDLNSYLSFASLNRHHTQLQLWTMAHFTQAVLAFIGIYILAVAISVPGAVFLTLTGGFLFGIIWGTLLVVFSATIGAVLVFLAVKSALGNWLAGIAHSWVGCLRKGFQKNAFSYMITLRLIPLFPFWVVNIVPAVLGVQLKTYVLATFLGIIPGSLVYVMVGKGLRHLFAQKQAPDLGIIFTPPILLPLIGLALLSLLPIFYQRYKERVHD